MKKELIQLTIPFYFSLLYPQSSCQDQQFFLPTMREKLSDTLHNKVSWPIHIHMKDVLDK